ncbi:hypothetical protein AGABI2DRAFT_114372 [Agaricus bisporus var. bisporus H97]|uniref:hypothetical protein n=1 Tax=Agaricus bisporus var. bisporus (strain H97 / ATCC MYA-4626 / FGSC 10389) TaxID=936046 RepID=UPI00029F8067|nr:hypothetical protein AGABI2DRAFT_114372 [Agaricus bisporus var. bisporus H97]EKV51652.1 hypothetical protein AGABI2DRAFT_114372 [Agaricus bisporus var. bisporus H97]
MSAKNEVHDEINSHKEDQKYVHEEELYQPEVDTSGIDEKKLMRKVDWNVIPWLALLYLLNSLDRGNIGNAKLYSLEHDLRMSDKQYLLALTLFFFPYSLFEPASNVALRRLKPSTWLSSMLVLWGIVMTMHGVVNNYAGLVALRLLLGLCEAGLYPGIAFYITSWYKSSEMGTKFALFFSSATIAGAFSGLLAAAIANMDGVGNKPAWAWIFILEGLFTVVIGLLSYVVIQDFPHNAKFLSETERVFIIRRLQSDNKLSAGGGETYRFAHVKKSLKDWKTWFAMAIYMGFDGPLYAFSLFTPSIINQLGFTATKANLLSVPVYAWGCLVTVAIGFWADRLGKRCLVNIGLFGTGLVGYIILICSRTPALSYFAVFLAISSIFPTVPNSVTWVASNVEGSYKRAVTLGVAIGFGNLNGAVTSNIYRAKDQPWYRLGHAIVLGYIIIGIISSLLFAYFLRRENIKRDRGERDEVIEGIDNPNARKSNGVYPSVEAAKMDKGDDWSGFRYTI